MSSNIKEDGCSGNMGSQNSAFQRILRISIIDFNPLSRAARRISVDEYASLISLNLTGEA